LAGEVGHCASRRKWTRPELSARLASFSCIRERFLSLSLSLSLSFSLYLFESSHCSPHPPCFPAHSPLHPLPSRSDGASRQFAFIGFRAAESGAAAVKHFDRTFFGTARLTAEPAREVGDDAALVRAWSRHTKAKVGAPGKGGEGGGGASEGEGGGERRGARAAKREAAAAATSGSAPELAGLRLGRVASEAAAGVKDKAALAEFIAAMRPRAAGPTWANDDALGRGAVPIAPSSRAAQREAAVAAAAVATARRGVAKDEDDDGASTDSGE
jgi:hypothetical protein